MAIRLIRFVPTPFQIAILKQGEVDFKRQQTKENDSLAFFIFAIAYALEFAIPVPHWSKSTSHKSENRAPSPSSELPHKVLWEFCVCVSVECFITIISIQLMSWFSRILYTLSCGWLDVTPRFVRNLLRITGLVIVSNMILRSFLMHLPESGWQFVLLVPVAIYLLCSIGTKLAGNYFESSVPDFQNLSILLALHEAGYPVCLASPSEAADLPPAQAPLSSSPAAFSATSGNSLREAASVSYAKVFAPHHGWAIRKAVGAAMYALPSRSQLLKRLNEDESSAKVEMQSFIRSSGPVIQYIEELFNSRQLGIDW